MADNVQTDPRVMSAWSGVQSALRRYEDAVAEAYADPRPVVYQPAPMAQALADHVDAGGTVQRWHAWQGGGGWGATFSGEDAVFRTMPPDQRQPGYRIMPRGDDDG